MAASEKSMCKIWNNGDWMDGKIITTNMPLWNSYENWLLSFLNSYIRPLVFHLDGLVISFLQLLF